jgi:bacterioferritin-associated ferredoxin
MYVCVCNGYRESEIEQTARASGLSCPVAVYNALGSGPCCGTCLPMAQDVINAALKSPCRPVLGRAAKRSVANIDSLPLAAE